MEDDPGRILHCTEDRLLSLQFKLVSSITDPEAAKLVTGQDSNLGYPK